MSRNVKVTAESFIFQSAYRTLLLAGLAFGCLPRMQGFPALANRKIAVLGVYTDATFVVAQKSAGPVSDGVAEKCGGIVQSVGIQCYE